MSSNIQIQRICQHCGKEFTARTTVTKFCGHPCSKAAWKAKDKTGKIESSNRETQQIKSRPIEEIKAKEFLSIKDTCKLLGISRRTVYRMFYRGEIQAGKAGKRTLIKRSSIDRLFDVPKLQFEEPKKPVEFVESECYNLADVRKKYGISQAGLRKLILNNNIPTFYKGWFGFVPKAEIERLLS